jgi:drug/metabolite transporter (DMT)-like permease
LAIKSVSYTICALVLAPMTLWLGCHFHFKRASAGAWWSLLYMALFGSVLAYLIYNYALVYIPASRVSAFSYMQPLGATLLAVPLLGELISTTLVIGGILVLTGVYITERA